MEGYDGMYRIHRRRMNLRSDRAMFARELLLALAVVILVSAAVVASYWTWEKNRVDTRLELGEAAALSRAATAIRGDFGNVRDDLFYLASMEGVRAALDDPVGPSADRLERAWLLFSNKIRLYDQIRLLDVH